MLRWTSIVGAVMLVLMLWTGGAAHAAERFSCIPAGAEVTGHFDGDEDQAPSNSDQGTMHHHSGCNGHVVAAPVDGSTIAIIGSKRTSPFAWREIGMRSRGPESELRPPIA